MEDKIKTLLENATVGTGIKVLTDALPNIFPSITFHFYDESAALYGKGKATEETVNCQIDLWYKVKIPSISTVKQNIKSAIISDNHFTHPSITTSYETGTKIYHTHFDFEALL